MEDEKIKIADESELPPPPSKIQIAGDEELPPPPKKKYTYLIEFGWFYIRVNRKSIGIRNPVYWKD